MPLRWTDARDTHRVDPEQLPHPHPLRARCLARHNATGERVVSGRERFRLTARGTGKDAAFRRVDHHFGADRLTPAAVGDHNPCQRTGFVRQRLGRQRAGEKRDSRLQQRLIQNFLHLKRRRTVRQSRASRRIGNGVHQQFAKQLPLHTGRHQGQNLHIPIPTGKRDSESGAFGSGLGFLIDPLTQIRPRFRIRAPPNV